MTRQRDFRVDEEGLYCPKCGLPPQACQCEKGEKMTQARVERIKNDLLKISLLGNVGGKVVILSEDWQEFWKKEG